MIKIRGFAPPNLSPSPVNHPCRRLRHNLDKKQSASLLIPSDLRCTGFGVYGRMPRSRFRLLQLTPRALLPDQGSLLRACSSRFKFSKGPLIVSAAARRHLLIFHAPVCSLMRPNFSTPDQSRANQNTAFRQAESAILICSSQIRSLPKLLSNQGTARA